MWVTTNINRIPIISLLRRFAQRFKTYKTPIIACEIIVSGSEGHWAFEVICSHFVSCDNGGVPNNLISVMTFSTVMES